MRIDYLTPNPENSRSDSLKLRYSNWRRSELMQRCTSELNSIRSISKADVKDEFCCRGLVTMLTSNR